MAAMRKPMPLRWIEQAEARQVLGLALCESPPAIDKPALWLDRIRDWVLSRPAPAVPAAPFDRGPAALPVTSRASSRYCC